MRTLGNLIWLVCGGLAMGLAWWVAGLVAFVSIVGIPWGRACFVIGELCFLPFGRSVADRRVVTGKADIGTGALGAIGNVLWFVFAGVWLAIGHVVSAVLCFVTILGIPFGLQHLKLAEIALAPIGKTVVLRR
ncbi:MAG TPA: YccF domain-containing protein [Thermoanaerobaculia bacterium]|nr:YccF domain-containing protein [Thermoanaerobaculia bacterium]